MKLNLECGSQLLNGYINTSSVPIPNLDKVPEETQFCISRYNNLDAIAENGSVDEIIFGQPINVINPNDIVDVLRHWWTKLTSGGKLTLQLLDIRRIGKESHRGSLNLQDIHSLVYGPNYTYKLITDTDIIKQILLDIGFKIMFVSIDNFTTVVEAVKIEQVKN